MSVGQHLQLQHQHVRALLQVLPRDRPAAALRAAVLQQQLNLGQLQHPRAHRLLLPVVLNTHERPHAHKHTWRCMPPLLAVRRYYNAKCWRDRWKVTSLPACRGGTKISYSSSFCVEIYFCLLFFAGLLFYLDYL